MGASSVSLPWSDGENSAGAIERQSGLVHTILLHEVLRSGEILLHRWRRQVVVWPRLNASWWGSLTDYERRLFLQRHTKSTQQYDEAMAKNGQYLQKLIDEKVQVRSFNEDVWDGFAEGRRSV